MNSATDSITVGSGGGTPRAARDAAIFITASDDAEEMTQHANDTGASALLRKSFTNQVLLKSVRSALQGRPGAAM